MATGSSSGPSPSGPSVGVVVMLTRAGGTGAILRSWNGSQPSARPTGPGRRCSGWGALARSCAGRALNVTATWNSADRGPVWQGPDYLPGGTGSPESSWVAEQASWERMSDEARAHVRRYTPSTACVGMPRELRRRLRCARHPSCRGGLAGRWHPGRRGRRVKLPDWQVEVPSEDRKRAEPWLAAGQAGAGV